MAALRNVPIVRAARPNVEYCDGLLPRFTDRFSLERLGNAAPSGVNLCG